MCLFRTSHKDFVCHIKKKNLPLGEAGGVHPCLVTSLGLYLQRTHMLVLPAHAVSFSHDTACTSNWREHTVYISLCNQIYRVFVVKTAPGSCYTHLTTILKSAFHLLTCGCYMVTFNDHESQYCSNEFAWYS
jgi:hypothetical protein